MTNFLINYEKKKKQSLFLELEYGISGQRIKSSA